MCHLSKGMDNKHVYHDVTTGPILRRGDEGEGERLNWSRSRGLAGGSYPKRYEGCFLGLSLEYTHARKE